MFCHRFNSLTTCVLFLADEQHEGEKKKKREEIACCLPAIVDSKGGGGGCLSLSLTYYSSTRATRLVLFSFFFIDTKYVAQTRYLTPFFTQKQLKKLMLH